MRILRRYLTLVALMFWLGGFTFYASVVVPVGSDVLNSDLRQGFITRRVTFFLNWIAAGGLAVLLGELLFSADRSRRRQWIRAGLWTLMVLCQAGLFWLHAHLDGLLQERGRVVLDPYAFRPAHRMYLWTHTVQWLAALVFVGLMLRAWQEEDRSAPGK